MKRLVYLNELHLQGNLLRFLPPDVAEMQELFGNNGVLLMAENPWILPIKEKISVGTSHLSEYLSSSTYKVIYERNIGACRKPSRAT